MKTLNILNYQDFKLSIDQKKYGEIESRVLALESYLEDLKKDSLNHENDEIIQYQYKIMVTTPVKEKDKSSII
jgi:hypothetical protein